MNKLWWQKIFFWKRPECMCGEQTQTLTKAVSGRSLRVECLHGEEGVCQRLREMGFCESSIVEKVSQSGALICKVCDAKVVLSKELAEKIIVKDISPCRKHQ